MNQLSDHLPLKQGLKQQTLISAMNAMVLSDHLPLKQGLKLRLACKLALATSTFRSSSIKTRIETNQREHKIKPRRTFRSSSIKTRIETEEACAIRRQNHTLSDHLPLKQGLKLVRKTNEEMRNELSDHLPLKQGLKLSARHGRNRQHRTFRSSSIKTRIET